MQSSNLNLSLPEANPNLNIPLRFTSYPLHPHYPDIINTFTCPTIELDWQLPQHLTLHELKYALTLKMNINAHSMILKRRTIIVGL